MLRIERRTVRISPHPWGMIPAAAFTMLIAAACQGQQQFVLVSDGEPRATIVVAPPVEPEAVELPYGSENARYKSVTRIDAAHELRDYVKRMTGVELPVVFDDGDVTGPRILVGESRYTREMGLSNGDFERQEYLIRATGDTLILMGRDETFEQFIFGTPNGPVVHHNPHPLETFQAVGTHYAVQDFLEKFCGVRWYFMGELGEVVPELDALAVEPVEIRRKPDTRHRSLYVSGVPPDYYWKPQLGRGPGYAPDAETETYWNTRRTEASVWGRHLKMGGTPMGMNHSFHIPFAWGILKVDENTYPGNPGANAEWRDWPLLTSEQVIAGFIETARKYFNQEITNLPPFAAAGDYFAVIPHDTESWGSHPETLKWIKPDRPDDPQAHRSRSSDYYWPFVDRVARQVQQTHPDKFIATLAYRTYMYPPDPQLVERLPDNVAVGFCLGLSTWVGSSSADDPFTEEWIIEQWSKVANPDLMFEWRYLLWPTNPHYQAFPDVNVANIGRMVRVMRKFGVRGGVFMQIDENHGTWWSYPALDHLRVYVAAKLLDDWTLDEQDIVDEYYRLFYGPAEQPMRKFWTYLQDAAYDYHPNRAPMYAQWAKRQKEPTQELWDWTVKCPPAHLLQLGDLIREARQLTAADSIYRRRVDLIDEAVYQAYLVRASREVLQDLPRSAVEARPRPFLADPTLNP